MYRFFAVLAAVWLALLPPLFTDGACTAEFDAEHALLAADQGLLVSPAAAMVYLDSRHIPHSRMSAQQCQANRPRSVDRCPAGTLLRAEVMVQNRICRYYRDDAIHLQLHYDEHDRLVRELTDMAPYKSLPIPFTGRSLHWGR